ncbi:stalk domain-containing protein [Paenibacillus koleovorans]|uniref:stalk domain-containing protein n=1 Tax=Paenibacillus koleovorans TaxID=121608 RepID=UPI000FDAB436|nr:stalk domain-containing protein [Paenibacillus koleovorans]
MKRWLGCVLGLVFLFGLGLSFWSSPAFACFRGPTTMEENFLEAQSIFTAKVLKVEAAYPSQLVATLETVESLKGTPAAFVWTNNDSDQCGLALQAGKTYLFYSHGAELPYASVFDGYWLSDVRTDIRLAWLRERVKPAPALPPRTDRLLLHRQNEIRLFLENRYLGKPARAAIADDSVYFPLAVWAETFGLLTDWNEKARTVSIRSAGTAAGKPELKEANRDELATPPDFTQVPLETEVTFPSVTLNVQGELVKDHPELFVYDRELYVPLRAVAEKLGYQLEWSGSQSAVTLKLPIADQREPKLLGIKYLLSDWGYFYDGRTDGSLQVLSLGGDSISYTVEGEMMPAMTVPFEHVLQEVPGWKGLRQYKLQFYLKTERSVVRLLASPELVHALESDAAFREKIGKAIGKPWAAVPANRVLHVTDFEE